MSEITQKRPWNFWVVGAALVAGLVLSVISMLHLCSTDCASAHEYRLWGLKFEEIGIPFFVLLLVGHLIACNRPKLQFLILLGLVGALGAEGMFIYAQKAIIGHWCPVCLAIAGCIAAATLGTLVEVYQHTLQELKMNKFFGSSVVAFALITGFLTASFGFAKFDRLAAEESDLKTTLAFGDKNSPVEVYFFTDWLCPACRQIEPAIEAMFPKVAAKAKFYFVDMAIHPETLNFTPYNLSFITYNKKDYFKLRDALTELSKKTKSPSDNQVEQIAKKYGIKYKQLDYTEVSTGIKYFKHLSKQFNIERTPTLVIVNRAEKKGKKFQGEGEITEENVLKSIQLMKVTK